MSEQVLERFHRALIEEIQTQRPEYLTSPFTVAEIYQHLVPYGSHRDRIGVEMNGDYEDALIRLLAGEGGYLILDSDPALRELQAELVTPNPNTGLYREFAGVDVRLNQAYLDLSAAAMDQLPDLVEELEAEDPVTMSALAPSEGTAQASALGIVPPGVDIFSTPEGTADPFTASSAAAPAGGMSSSSTGMADAGFEAHPGSGRPPLAPEFVEEVEAEEPQIEESHMEDPQTGESQTGESLSSRSAMVAAPSDGACRWCSESLPTRAPLNFCPFCGTDQNLVPCVACGEEIEPGWSFCAACGAEAESLEVSD